jgi:hypothetical protein
LACLARYHGNINSAKIIRQSSYCSPVVDEALENLSSSDCTFHVPALKPWTAPYEAGTVPITALFFYTSLLKLSYDQPYEKKN